MITVKNVLGLSFLVKGDKLKKLDKLKLKLKKLDWVTNPVRVLVMNIWGIIIKPRRLYLWVMNLYQVWKLPWLTWLSRLFTVLYFSVRSSRSSALRFGLHLAWVSKLLRGQGAVWEEARKIDFSRPPPPRAIIPDARPLGTFENHDGRH